MVWFQCEDGENLKKPIGQSVPNLLRRQVFVHRLRRDVRPAGCPRSHSMHHRRRSMARKDGGEPRTLRLPSPITTIRSNNPIFTSKSGCGNVPRGFAGHLTINELCNLCDTKATSKQSLLLRAEGKKHREKARAFHPSKQPSRQGG